LISAEARDPHPLDEAVRAVGRDQELPVVGELGDERIDVDPVGAWTVVLEEDQRLGEEMDGAARGAAARAEVERGGELDEALEKGAFLRGCRAPGVLPHLLGAEITAEIEEAGSAA